MRRFGQYGRFGNSLLQYAFLRNYADSHRCKLVLPYWIGKEFFGLSEEYIPLRLSQLAELEQPKQPGEKYGLAISPESTEYINHDVYGWFQFRIDWHAPYKSWWHTTYRKGPGPERVKPFVNKLRQKGTTVIGIHYRAGDYNNNWVFWRPPIKWYLDWLDINWKRFDDPVLFIACEDRAFIDNFKQYPIETVETLGVPLNDKPYFGYNYLDEDKKEAKPHLMDFFPEWFLLANCHVLAIPNSTFSFTAAMANPNLKELWRAKLSAGAFIQIDPFNEYPCDHEKAEDYLDILNV